MKVFSVILASFLVSTLAFAQGSAGGGTRGKFASGLNFSTASFNIAAVQALAAVCAANPGPTGSDWPNGNWSNYAPYCNKHSYGSGGPSEMLNRCMADNHTSLGEFQDWGPFQLRMTVRTCVTRKMESAALAIGFTTGTLTAQRATTFTACRKYFASDDAHRKPGGDDWTGLICEEHYQNDLNGAINQKSKLLCLNSIGTSNPLILASASIYDQYKGLINVGRDGKFATAADFKKLDKLDQANLLGSCGAGRIYTELNAQLQLWQKADEPFGGR